MKYLLSAVFLLSSLTAFAEPVTAVVQLPERVSVSSLAKTVNDPESPRYQKFYTPDEIRQLSGPTDAQFAQVMAQLSARHIQVVRVSKSHLFVTVRADRSVLANLRMSNKALTTQRTGIVDVLGLDPSAKRHPYIKIRTARDATFNGFLPAQIQQAYGFLIRALQSARAGRRSYLGER